MSTSLTTTMTARSISPDLDTIIERVPVYSEEAHHQRVEVADKDILDLCNKLKELIIKTEHDIMDVSFRAMEFCKTAKHIDTTDIHQYFSAIYMRSIQTVYNMQKTDYVVKRKLKVHSLSIPKFIDRPTTPLV